MTFRLTAITAFVTAFILGLTACSDDKTNVGVGGGQLDVTVITNPTLEAPGVEAMPDSLIPTQDEFTIVITDAAGTSAKWTGETLAGVPELLLPGRYSLTAYSGRLGAEGFVEPCFIGRTDLTITNGETTHATVTASLATVPVIVKFDPSLTAIFPDISATLHSLSGIYCTYTADDSGVMFLRPGDLTITANLSIDGRSVTFDILEIPDTRAATYYGITLSAEKGQDGITTVSAEASSGHSASRALTPEFLNAPAPELRAEGFTSGVTITIPEGSEPETPLRALVSSPDLAHLYISGVAPSLGSVFASEIDLLTMDAAITDSLATYGITVEGLGRGEVRNGIIDLTRLPERIQYFPGETHSTLSLKAIDASGRASQPLTLSISISKVNIQLLSVSHAVIGLNRAQLTLSSSSPELDGNIVIETLDADTRRWIPAQIDSISSAGDGRYNVLFTVPDGLSPLTARLLFCGEERQTFTIRRSAPEFFLDADAYALHADIQITAPDPEIIPVITSSLRFFSNDKELSLVERSPSDGLITIFGLDPSTVYNISTTLLPYPATAADGTAGSISFTTEAAAQLPNSDFEDTKRTIIYDDMLSGGRYSQNQVAIFNLQNHSSFDLRTPERWANVNAKTFCTSASNHNTWYLAPSAYTVEDAYSGAYAIRLDCVGYSIDGPEIQPYLQTTLPYTQYSLNIPSGIDHAAGRLFLGSYTFNAEDRSESYDEGLPFTSRPEALNGFYKFSPTAANPRANALARIEVLGRVDGVDIVIARGEANLNPALSYTAFTIPLSYDHSRVKASSIRILFAPSDAIGDIERETESIIVTPDPASATFRGSSLWIDNLSLSY